MVDPETVNRKRNEFELQEFALFCIAVAGKNAKNIAKALNRFLGDQNTSLPFETIKSLHSSGMLETAIRNARLGQYTKLTKAFYQISQLDLKTCTLEELEKVHGIGFKTSRFFLTYTRPNQKFSILDTHILRYMREELGITTPKSTPSNFKKYRELEDLFIKHCEKSNRLIADLDLEIWTRYSNKKAKTE